MIIRTRMAAPRTPITTNSEDSSPEPVNTPHQYIRLSVVFLVIVLLMLHVDTESLVCGR